MHVVVVGAGAVGQVYGFYLAKAGHTVTFYVRPKYVADLRDHPLTLQRLDGGRLARREQFTNYTVISTLAELKALPTDVLAISVSGDAARTPGFITGLVSAIPPNATILNPLPGIEDTKFLVEDCGINADRIVATGITFIAWQAPLPGERFAPVKPSGNPNAAIGYVLPKANPFSGKPERVTPILKAFQESGLGGYLVDSVYIEFGFAAGMLGAMLAGLEASHWDFAKLRNSAVIGPTAAAMGEAVAISTTHIARTQNVSQGRRTFWAILRFYMRYFFGGFTLRVASIVAPYTFNFDIESYLKYHFIKVSKQRALYTEIMLRIAKEENMPTDNLRYLQSKLLALQS